MLDDGEEEEEDEEEDEEESESDGGEMEDDEDELTKKDEEELKILKYELEQMTVRLNRESNEKWETLKGNHKSLQKIIEEENIRTIIKNVDPITTTIPTSTSSSSPPLIPLIPLNLDLPFYEFIVDMIKEFGIQPEPYLISANQKQREKIERIKNLLKKLHQVETYSLLQDVKEQIWDLQKSNESSFPDSFSSSSFSSFSLSSNSLLNRKKYDSFKSYQYDEEFKRSVTKKNNNNNNNNKQSKKRTVKDQLSLFRFRIPDNMIPRPTYDQNMPERNSNQSILEYINSNHKYISFHPPQLLKDQLENNPLSFQFIRYKSNNFKKLAIVSKCLDSYYNSQHNNNEENRNDDDQRSMVNGTNFHRNFLDLMNQRRNDRIRNRETHTKFKTTPERSKSSINRSSNNNIHHQNRRRNQIHPQRYMENFMHYLQLNPKTKSLMFYIEQYFKRKLLMLIERTIGFIKVYNNQISIFSILNSPYDQHVFKECFRYLHKKSKWEEDPFMYDGDEMNNQKPVGWKPSPRPIPVTLRKNFALTIHAFLGKYKTLRKKYHPHIPDYRQNMYTGFLELPYSGFSNDHNSNVRKAKEKLGDIDTYSFHYRNRVMKENSKPKKKKKKKKKKRKEEPHLSNSYVGNTLMNYLIGMDRL